MDKFRYQLEGLKWLAELEMLNHPQLINQLKLNVMMTSKHIKEVELLIYRENKSMLVLLELSWLGRKFFKKSIFADVEDVLTQILTSFRFRVTDDPKIMEMAVAKVKRALGGINESTNSSSSLSATVTSGTVATAEGSPKGEDSNTKEQPKAVEGIQPATSTDDSGEKP